MLFWSIKITFLSIILIFLVHYLINFFKSTLTVPKIKDLVNTPTQKYENMFNVISSSDKHSNNDNISNNNITNNITNSNNQVSYTEIDLLPKPDETSMKNELKNFLKKQMDNNSENYNLKAFSEPISYSTF
jgi:hypothetical protein